MNALDALYLPLAIITAPWWARKTRSGWGERFGHIPLLPAKQPGVPRVLLHAVSVGEVGTVLGLLAGTYKPLQPGQEYAAFVERCLKEKGYETEGWQ